MIGYILIGCTAAITILVLFCLKDEVDENIENPWKEED